jgi:hypothetical protein
MLPELHGFDIARRIKGSAKYGSIPVLMMSAVYAGWRIARTPKSSYGIEGLHREAVSSSQTSLEIERLLEREAGRLPRTTPSRSRGTQRATSKMGIAAYRTATRILRSHAQSGDRHRSTRRTASATTSRSLRKARQFYDGIRSSSALWT